MLALKVCTITTWLYFFFLTKPPPLPHSANLPKQDKTDVQLAPGSFPTSLVQRWDCEKATTVPSFLKCGFSSSYSSPRQTLYSLSHLPSPFMECLWAFSFVLYFFEIYYFMCTGRNTTSVCICAPCACSDYGGQKRASDPQALELQTTVSCYTHVENL